MRVVHLSLAMLLLGAVLAPPALAANSVFLAEPGTSLPAGEISVSTGQPVTLDLRMDFLDTTVGGGVALVLEPSLLRVEGVTFDPALPDSSKLRCPPGSSDPPSAGCPTTENLIAFGALTGLRGSRRVATLHLMGLAEGTTHPGLVAAQAFSDATGRPLPVRTVPEPGRGILLIAGAGVLGLLRSPGDRVGDGNDAGGAARPRRLAARARGRLRGGGSS